MLIIFLAVIISAIMKLLKQPLIIGYILTGILASHNFLNIVKSEHAIEAFAQIGIVLLLFLVGLSLNPNTIKDVGKISVITGVGQVLFTSIFGYFIMILFGFSVVTSLYVAVAITFSSTIIIMKLLTDKNDQDTLYGKISIGFLIVQDIIAMFILMIVSASAKEGDLTLVFIEALVKGFGLLIVMILLAVFVVPKIFKWSARSQEFLLLISIAWCLAIAASFYYFNFSMEVGALLAGVALAASPYRHEISSKLKPLRDFFIVIFFILLGSQMNFISVQSNIFLIVVLSLFILIGNPLIVLILLGSMNYKKRTGFMSGLTVAQISEFSLILIALGVTLGHLSADILSVVTVVGLITIAGSTYMIIYSNWVYNKISRYLKIFERKSVHEKIQGQDEKYDIILFGYNRIGNDIFDAVKKIGTKYLIVDYNPDTIQMLEQKKLSCKYGDANDLELLNELNFKDAKMVISTVPEIDTNLLLIKKANETNPMIITIVVSHQIDESLKLYDAGATYVVMPHFLGGKHMSFMLNNYGLDINKFIEERLFHIENLKNKKSMGFEHPENQRNKK